jgi:hypothetical protein
MLPVVDWNMTKRVYDYRLHLQHWMWNYQLGYLLHPSIPKDVPDLKVAEVAAGNGCVLLPEAPNFSLVSHTRGRHIARGPSNSPVSSPRPPISPVSISPHPITRRRNGFQAMSVCTSWMPLRQISLSTLSAPSTSCTSAPLLASSRTMLSSRY